MGTGHPETRGEAHLEIGEELSRRSQMLQGPENGRNALEMIKEERSEKAESEKGDRRGSLYPSLRDLEQTESEDSHSEDEIQALMSKLEAEVLKRKKTFKDKKQIPAKAAECHSPMPAPPPYQKGISSVHPPALSGRSFCLEISGRPAQSSLCFTQCFRSRRARGLMKP